MLLMCRVSRDGFILIPLLKGNWKVEEAGFQGSFDQQFLNFSRRIYDVVDKPRQQSVLNFIQLDYYAYYVSKIILLMRCN